MGAFVIYSVLLLSVLSYSLALQNQIRVAAVFDQDQDPKHALAFKYGVERVNRDPTILPGKRLVPEIVKVPKDDR